jgi:hypothetical protein
MTRTPCTAVTLALAFALFTPFRATAAEPSPSTPLSGSDVLAHMAQTYATCRSYSDTGVVRIVYFEEGRQRTEERPFKTAFVRPDHFRFEFTDTFLGKSRRYIVWQQGLDVYTWWDIKPGQQTLSSLDLGLAGATGVSGGSAHTVPSLLLPGVVSGRSLRELTDITRLEDAACGTATCAQVEGLYGKQTRTLWIELDTFLLRRIDEATTFPSFRTERTTTYSPTVNEVIPPEILAFDPPRPQ